MERRFQYYVPFTNHTQYRARARAREHNNTMEKLILYFTHLYEHTHLIHVHEHYMYVRIFILGIWHEEGAVTSERSVLVKIVNSNFMPTLRGFRWYPYFVGQEQLEAFEASK